MGIVGTRRNLCASPLQFGYVARFIGKGKKRTKIVAGQTSLLSRELGLFLYKEWIRLKRILILFVCLLALSPISQSFAATSYSLTVLYDGVKDNYMVAYYRQIPIRPAGFVVKFVNPSNAAANAEKTFTGADVSGTFYLTCNGQYTFDFYDDFGVLTGSSQTITTTQVVGNICSSYSSPVDQYGGATVPRNQNNVQTFVETGTGGTVLPGITWDYQSGITTRYCVYKDSVEVQCYSNDDNLNRKHYIDGPGIWEVVTTFGGNTLTGEVPISQPSIDSGNYTDPYAGVPAPPGDGTPPPGGGGETPTPNYPPFDPNCPTCTELNQLLQCPDWDAYMGEFTTAFRNALPPPPDWQDIANKIGKATVDELSDYIGPVPTAPTQQEIDANVKKPLPPVDTHAPDPADMIPTLPPGYEQPKPFDINSGPEIAVPDDSQPFQILQPLNNIVYDPPGVAPKPGAPTNNSGGIQNPVPVTLPSPKPTPAPTTSPTPKPTVTSNPVPTPTTPTTPPPTATTPKPATTTSPVPIPAIIP